MTLTESIAAEQRRQRIIALENDCVRDAYRMLLDEGPDAALAVIVERAPLIQRYKSGGARCERRDND